MVRVAIPVAALVAAGSPLPELPRYRRPHGLSGDATGFYATAREFMAAWGRIPAPALAALGALTVAGAVALIREWRRSPRRRTLLLLAAAWWVGLLLVVNVAEERFAGAAVVGWPIVWAVPMLPVRLAGATLDQNVAFWLGLPLQLACNVATVVATAYAGMYASGRRSVGLAAGAVFAFWPLLTGLIGGHRAWGNGTWPVDAGLHMYTEPLSTALVAIGLALLLSPRLTPLRLTLAGAALGYATTVKVSNCLAAAGGLLLLAWRFRGDARRIVPFAAGGLAFAPLVLAYWPLGYSRLRKDPTYWPQDPFRLSYVQRSWTDSLLFTPRTLAIILPLAVLGLVALRRAWPLAVLLVWTLANPLLYSFYFYTPIDPRFLWASLPSFFVLWAAGAALLVDVAVASARAGAGGAPRSPSGRRSS
jgi:hypothetical protein